MRSRSSNGFFLVLEGIDGSGKTTIANMLIKDLSSMGFKVHYTYEPWVSQYVKVLKEDYRDLRDAYLDALTYACDRLIHLKKDVLEKLSEGYIVVSDRYYYSSVAYQSSQNAPFEWVLAVNSMFPEPDLAILLDVDPEVGLRRKTGSTSRFPEYENVDFLIRVRENYLKLVKMGKLVLINANTHVDNVYREVYNLFMEKYRALNK